MTGELEDKNAKPIKVGDHVFTPIRGGRREGDVSQLIHNEEEAEAAGVKNPPKVAFTDQHGHNVAHNPGTLSHKAKEK